MDPSSALHHHQEMSSQTLESMLVSTKPQQEIKKLKPPTEQSLNCPRCDSTNTKFCYYNNYSLSQPRYFCKSCRRYWTKGGTLRNVPVGGGCRKKQKSSSSSKITSQEITSSQNNPIISSFTQQMSYDSSDLSLAFARLQKQTNGHFGIENHNNISMMSSAPSSHEVLGFLENPSNVGFYQNLYYGNIGNNNNNNGDMGHVENGGNYMGNMNYDQEISSNMTTTSTTTATTMTTVKQEMCNMARDQGENENKVLWGFPWQINGDNNGNYNMGEFDSNRRIWNGVGGSSWHGLLNSPLM